MKKLFFLFTIILSQLQLTAQPIYEMDVDPSTTKKVMYYFDGEGSYVNGDNNIGESESTINFKIYHTAYRFNLPTLPAHSTIVSCAIEAEVTDYYGEESTAIIKLLSDGSIPVNREDVYNMVENGSELFNFNYDETGSYDITNTYSSKINQGYINLGAMAEYMGNGLSNHADITIKLIIEYHQKFSIDITYNFFDTGIEVKAGVDEAATAKNIPYEALAYRGQTVNIEAIEDQTDNNGYVRIWNDTEAPIAKSNWTRSNQSGNSIESYNQAYSFTVISDDSNATYTAQLKKKCYITFAHEYDQYEDFTIYVNGQAKNSPSTNNLVYEENEIEGRAINQTIDYVEYTFSKWNTNSTNLTQKFYPTENTTYTAEFNVEPKWTNRNLHTNSTPGAYITVYWNEHPCSDVVYKIYRKIKTNGIMGSEVFRATVNHGTTSWTDNIQIADGQTTMLVFYDVRAYHTPSSTYSDVYYESTVYSWTEQNIQTEDQYQTAEANESSLAEEEVTPTETTLGNFANPFNPSTVISYQLAVDSKVVLKVYDMLGKEVATLVNDTKPAGSYNVSFNGANLPSGVYIYTLQTNNKAITQKMLLMTRIKKFILRKIPYFF